MLIPPPKTLNAVKILETIVLQQNRTGETAATTVAIFCVRSDCESRRIRSLALFPDDGFGSKMQRYSVVFL
jgi:hypothetical protein